MTLSLLQTTSPDVNVTEYLDIFGFFVQFGGNEDVFIPVNTSDALNATTDWTAGLKHLCHYCDSLMIQDQFGLHWKNRFNLQVSSILLQTH